MQTSRTGVWFIGARGGVAATASLGLLLLAKKALEPIGLVTTLPAFQNLDLIDWGDLVIGGHEIRSGSLTEAAASLQKSIGGIDHNLVDSCREELANIDERICQGTLSGCGDTIAALTETQEKPSGSAQELIHRLQADLQQFQQAENVDRVIVVNLASTEPGTKLDGIPDSWEDLERLLSQPHFTDLPASSLYAIAALDLGMPYINFTPSLGSTPPAICELAELRGTCHAGRDGKTGETLLKSVLAPMFAARNLNVMSWVGHNIFGNMDGQILDDPINKLSKLQSKDQLLGKILGNSPQTHVSIEYIQSMGDWKTAWDHIHFQGFLGTPMTMQFTWQGCDSILAAPLVLDLVRIVDYASKRTEKGVLSYLASFFKSPLATDDHDFFRQLAMLQSWVSAAHNS